MMTPLEYNRRLPRPGEYARSWRALLAMAPDEIVSVPGWVVNMPGWGRQSVPVHTALGALRVALDARINARAGFEPREPREGTHAHLRDSLAALSRNTRRVRVYQFETRQARVRLGHLLASRED